MALEIDLVFSGSGIGMDLVWIWYGSGIDLVFSIETFDRLS